MSNDREESVWYINNKGNDGISADTNPYITISDYNGWSSAVTASNIYTKSDHDDGGIGLNRTFDTELVDDIDRIYRDHWDLPEYLPFRECVKMGIQDGIKAGRKVAKDILAGKDKEIETAKAETEHWKNAFKGLLIKCREGVEAFEFISKVVHLDNQAKGK
jgi:hypothetical protein